MFVAALFKTERAWGSLIASARRCSHAMAQRMPATVLSCILPLLEGAVGSLQAIYQNAKSA
jgi:hypothetical protein